MKKLFLLALGALTLAALPAHADAAGKKKRGTAKAAAGKKSEGNVPGDIEVKHVEVTQVNGDRVELRIDAHKTGAAVEYPVEITFVEGQKRSRLWSKKIKFKGGGFKTAATIDVRGKNLKRGKVEVMVVGCGGGKCKKDLKLDKGDLVFGRPKVETRGTKKIVSLDVTNNGPEKSSNCKVVFKVDNRKVGEQTVSALDKGKKKKVSFEHRGRGSFKAELDCSDLSSRGNTADGRL